MSKLLQACPYLCDIYPALIEAKLLCWAPPAGRHAGRRRACSIIDHIKTGVLSSTHNMLAHSSRGRLDPRKCLPDSKCPINRQQNQTQQQQQTTQLHGVNLQYLLSTARMSLLAALYGVRSSPGTCSTAREQACKHGIAQQASTVQHTAASCSANQQHAIACCGRTIGWLCQSSGVVGAVTGPYSTQPNIADQACG